MQRWEYCRLVIYNKSNILTFVSVDGVEWPGYRNVQVDTGKLHILNTLGDDRWELATSNSVDMGDELSVEYIMKRAK